MDASIALILAQDGITTGAVYALLAVGLVLIFAVTRVIFIPQGELVAYGALTIAVMQAGQLPATVWLLLAMGAWVFLLDLWHRLRRAPGWADGTLWRSALANLAWPLLVFLCARFASIQTMALPLQIALTLAIVAPMGPLLYRLAFEPVAHASVLVLLIVSVAAHFVLLGLGLVMFGAEGARSLPFSNLRFALGPLTLTGQGLSVIGASLLIMAALSLFFSATVPGKALRATAVNRLGARLMGIDVARSGRLAFLLAGLIGAFSGVLIGPVTTLYYDSGFLIGLKGFVAAIIGGLASYPIAAAGALLVGLIEAYASFFASAYKEVLVFTLIVPVLAWRSFTSHSLLDEEEEVTTGPVTSSPSLSRLPHAGMALWALAMAAMAFLPVPQFWITLANYIGLYSLVALGLVLLTGIAGMTSFGQAAFVGLGAYASAVLTTSYGASPWVGLVAGLALVVLAASALGAITMRLSGHYLPLGTIAWGLGLYYLFGNLDVLRKFDGITGIPAIQFFGIELQSGRNLYLLIWAIVALAVLAILNLLDSRSGRAIRALRGGVVMAESCGVNTARTKLLAFVLAAVLAGLSGWLYAHLQRAVNPTPFGLNAGISYLFMAVVGGAGYVWGALAGAALVTLLGDWLQSLLPRLLGQSGNFEVIVLGALLILLLQRAPGGFWPLLLRISHRLRHRPDPSAARPVLPPPAGLRAAGLARPLPRRSLPATASTVLEVRRARKAFGGLVAVNDVSFSLKAGEILGLIGPNGAGKSTLFNLVSGVLPLSGGEVHFMGQRVDGKPSRWMARAGLARTFQHVRLMPAMSVIENVAIGAHLRGHRGWLAGVLRGNRVEEASLFAHSQAQLDRVSLGGDALREAGSLALGQQRILEIARALASDPALLLLDEPAAGLRHQEKQALAALLRQLSGEGVSILLVEHDMDFVMGLVHRVVVMDFGTRIAEGAPEAVRCDPVVIEAYLGGVE